MTMNPEPMKITASFMDVKPGDIVTRLFYGVRQQLTVSHVSERIIHTTGGWEFDRSTGIEHDPELGFGVDFGISISQLIRDDS